MHSQLWRLSPREHEVMQHMRAGATNAQIASYLGVAIGTVNVHVHSILEKLGARNRSHAVGIYLGEIERLYHESLRLREEE